MFLQGVSILFVALCLEQVRLMWAFQSPSSCATAFAQYRQRLQIRYYDYFKKGPEKKDIGRLWKNIIFPGIYVEYADTQEPKKTVKVVTKTRPILRPGNEGDSFGSTDPKSGTYSVVDPSTVPKLENSAYLQGKEKPIRKPDNFRPPTPKKAISASLSSGVTVLSDASKFTRPKKPIILYDCSSSKDCGAVRKVASQLDLVVEYRPCPGGRAGYSDVMATIAQGKRELPFLVDNNPMYKPQLFGAQAIIEYLYDSYGPGKEFAPKSSSVVSSFNLFDKIKSTGKRDSSRIRSDVTSLRPITLYGWEGAPYVTPVREVLTELALAHVLVNCAPGSRNRDALISKTGLFQVPYIVDPNTGVEMFESAEIMKYLRSTYSP